MALSKSVLSEMLEAGRAGEGVDLIRDAVQLVLQELIKVEAFRQIGAGRYEGSDARVTERSGARTRLLTSDTPADGDRACCACGHPVLRAARVGVQFG